MRASWAGYYVPNLTPYLLEQQAKKQTLKPCQRCISILDGTRRIRRTS